jgi:hypothetical protein
MTQGKIERYHRWERHSGMEVMTLRAIAKYTYITPTLRAGAIAIGDRPMAANHIVGLGELVRTATATLVVAILVVSAMPVCAQGQQPSAVQLKADAQNVVKIIIGDKLKIESYCKFADISDQCRSRRRAARRLPGCDHVAPLRCA